MQFSINYSPQAADLLRNKQITIDRFKCPDWPDMVALALTQCQVGVHFDLDAGRGKLEATDWEHVRYYLNWTQTPYVNLHLVPRHKHHKDIPVVPTQEEQRQRLIRKMIADVNVVARQFGAGQVIAENVPYQKDMEGVIQTAVEPEVIQQVLKETGCGLLLDLSHARISARSLGMDEKEYLLRLPIQQLKEMHVTGLWNLNGRLYDHLEMQEDDWELLTWVLDNIRRGDWPSPWMIAFEYGGIGEPFAWRSNPEIIAGQVPRLYEMAHSV